MKKFMIFGLMFSALTVNAAERSIYDLMYLPKAGTFYGQTGLNLINGKASGEVVGEDFDIDLGGYTVEQALGYSFTDRLTVSASMEYSSLTYDYDFSDALVAAGADEANGSQRGLGDPTIAARFRLLEDSINVDLLAAYSIKTGDRVTDRNDNNNKMGGNSSRFGVQAGQKNNDLQWAFGLTYDRYYQATNRVKGDDKTRDEAHDAWLLEGSALYRLAEKSFIRGELGYEFTDEYKDNQDTKVVSRTTGKIRAEYQHLVSENLLAKVGLGRNWIQTAGYDDFAFWTLHIGANYQF